MRLLTVLPLVGCNADDNEFKPLTNGINSTLITCTDPATRIIGGVDADKNSWPWLVQLDIYQRSGVTDNCGGTIIDDNWVCLVFQVQP